MRALTLTQPWASLVILGIKRLETRGWSTPYRGPLAIHSSKAWTPDDRGFARDLNQRGIIPVTPSNLPMGMVLGTVDLVDVFPSYAIEVTPLEDSLGDFGPDRFAWVLGDPRPFTEPVPARGALGLWNLPAPAPHELWNQARGESELYRHWMRQFGHLVPKG